MLLLGHRGALRELPENTIESFELCLQHGCDGFEFDVRRSGDGQAVICHDPQWQGYEVAATKADRLGLPLLQEILERFADRAFLDIELKVPGLEPQTLSLLRHHPPRKGFVVSSFLPEVVNSIHALDPAIPLGLICRSQEQFSRWRDLPLDWVILHESLLSSLAVREISAAGKRFMAWTVNDADRIRESADLGTAAIISDQTELLVEMFGKKPEKAALRRQTHA